MFCCLLHLVHFRFLVFFWFNFVLVFRASFVKDKIRSLYFGWFPCFFTFESCKMVPKWVRTNRVCIWVGLTCQMLKMMNSEFLFVLKKIHHLCAGRVFDFYCLRFFDIYLFSCILYAYAFLFTFVICAILIYFMHEYILEKFILCIYIYIYIYIWNQIHNIIF